MTRNEVLMRLLLPATILAAVAVVVSTGAPAQAPLTRARPVAASPSPMRTTPHVPDQRAVALVRNGNAALSAGQLDQAADAYETALAVDPGYAEAYSLLGQIALRQQLPGKALRLYREALSLDRAHVDALAGEGIALAAKGAVTQARENLTRLRGVCGATCPQASSLEAAIARGPARTAPAS